MYSKITTLRPLLIFPTLNNASPSKQIPYPLYLYLLVSAFLVICIAQNKAFCKLKVSSLLVDIGSNL